MINNKLYRISWIETSNKINERKIIRKNDKLHSWICNHPQVFRSPLKNEHSNIKDHIIGEVIKTHKLIIQVPKRELHNNLIKPPP